MKTSYLPIEKFESMANIPSNNLVAWMETTQYNNTATGTAISAWIPAKFAPSANFFSTNETDKNKQPYIIQNILNGHAVLNFTPSRYLQLNNLGTTQDSTMDDFTMIMVCRQTGGVNRRLLQGGWHNTLYGYWYERKEMYWSDNTRKWVLENYNESEPIILSTSEEISIKDIVDIIVENMYFKGNVIFDKTKPDGQFRKPTDNSKIKNYLPNYEFIKFEDGIKETIDWFENHYPNIR